MKSLYQKHCQDTPASAALEDDVSAEYARQRQYLERTVDGLKKKLARDTEVHRADNLKIMQENVALIREINELRREIKVIN